MDVFLRQAGSRRILDVYRAALRPDGALLCFSMFHRRWKGLLRAAEASPPPPVPPPPPPALE